MTYPRRSIWPPALFHAAFMAFTVFWIFMVLHSAVIATTEAAALIQRGVDTEATITRLWFEKSDDSARYLGSYSFAAEGREFTGESKTDEQQWKQLEVGGRVIVRYLPDDPAVSGTMFARDKIDSDGGRSPNWVVVCAFAAVGLAFLLGSVISLIGIRRLFWLRDHGVMRAANVINTEQDDGTWVVTWRDDAGVEGRASGISGKICPRVGATITVFAHPKKRWGTVWEGDVGSRVERSG